MALTPLPVGPGVPPGLASLLQSFHDAITQLQTPGAPSQAYVFDTTAGLLAQAPAASYPNCYAIVTDVPCLAISVETSPGVWEWLRADGSAL